MASVFMIGTLPTRIGDTRLERTHPVPARRPDRSDDEELDAEGWTWSRELSVALIPIGLFLFVILFDIFMNNMAWGLHR